ncbi:tetratricopeptide repeat protein, partial [Micromonospora haikouensis]|uniref:tetratricopeptide repeat protein n=1 Tax=Micromonospora haikouensis TaxID=686309 RepID=UPI00343E2965
GDAVAARDQLAAVLRVQERVLGAEHPNTLTTRRSLAVWTGNAGDAVAARDQLAAVLRVQERVLGAEHPNTLTTRHGLAWLTKEKERS